MINDLHWFIIIIKDFYILYRQPFWNLNLDFHVEKYLLKENHQTNQTGADRIVDAAILLRYHAI